MTKRRHKSAGPDHRAVKRRTGCSALVTLRAPASSTTPTAVLLYGYRNRY
jgi:hypothetical protein